MTMGRFQQLNSLLLPTDRCSMGLCGLTASLKFF